MIISLRGTNGSGKSTIVRRVMVDCDAIGTRTMLTKPDRKKPVGYLLPIAPGHLTRLIGPGTLLVPGHYEIANGGIDTLRSLDEAYELIWQYAQAECHVLYEGKNMSDGPRRLVELTQRGAVAHVIMVDHPLADCVKSVRERGHRIQERTIEKLRRKAYSDLKVFREEGIAVSRLSREEAYVKVISLLGLYSARKPS